jgi:hypothetical protein
MIMSRYFKKLITIEAEKISELLNNAKNNWDALPDWVKENYDAGKILFFSHNMEIFTDEGIMRGDKNDFLIKGVHGEIYPCKPDVFEETYEKIE